MKMLILPGIAGTFRDIDSADRKVRKNYPDGAIDESSAVAFARLLGFEALVIRIPGWNHPGNKQVTEALRQFRNDTSISGLYGFSGGGYNARLFINDLSDDEKNRLKWLIVLGAPKRGPQFFTGPWTLVYRNDPDPPLDHMDGPRVLLDSWSKP